MIWIRVPRWIAAAFMAALLAAPFVFSTYGQAAGSNAKGESLRPADVKAIKATIEAYRKSWLSNDSRGVLGTFTEDAVLLPAQGKPPVVGGGAIERYWFAPGGPPTTITFFEITVDEVEGNSRMAFARGLDSVGWTVVEKGGAHRHFQPGTYLNVMKKMPDGSWKVRVQMWTVGPDKVD